MRRSRIIVLVLCSALLGAGVLLLGQWLLGFRTTINGDEGEPGSYGVEPARVGETYSLQLEKLCVEHGKSVTITAVRPAHATAGLKIVDFALDAPAASRGPEAVPLATYLDTSAFGTTGFGKPRTLENRCGSSQSNVFISRPLAVAVRVEKLPAVIMGVEVDYRVRGITRTATFRNGAGFCRGDETEQDDDEMIAALDLDEDEAIELHQRTCAED